jgi:thioester reductase-like protein
MTTTAALMDEIIHTIFDRSLTKAAANARLMLDAVQSHPQSFDALRLYVVASAQSEEFELSAAAMRRLVVPAATVIDNMERTK